MKIISYTNHCAGNVDESQLTYRGAVLQTSNTSKGKRKASENSIYINEKPLKKAHNNSMLFLD